MVYLPSEDSYALNNILKQEIPKLIRKNSNLKFLEIGAGSGIHLLTAEKIGIKKENIFSSDIDEATVSHCNLLGYNCIKSNLFEKIKDIRFPSEEPKEINQPQRKGRLCEGNQRCPRFDLIIFNPPYLPEHEKDKGIDTTGGKKGDEIILEFLKSAKNYLNENGRIFLLTSSLTPRIDFKKLGYKSKQLICEKLFYEQLCVWELIPF